MLFISSPEMKLRKAFQKKCNYSCLSNSWFSFRKLAPKKSKISFFACKCNLTNRLTKIKVSGLCACLLSGSTRWWFKLIHWFLKFSYELSFINTNFTRRMIFTEKEKFNEIVNLNGNISIKYNIDSTNIRFIFRSQESFPEGDWGGCEVFNRVLSHD